MSSKKFVAINVFYGDESYLLDRAKEKALAWPDREVTALEGKDTTEGDIVSAMDEFSYDSSERVVLVDNAEKVKLTKYFTKYLNDRYPEGQPQDPSTSLVAIVRGPLPKTWSNPAAKGRAFVYSKFKPWEEAKIQKRVNDEAQLLGLTVDPAAFSMLYKVYREDTGRIVNELNKMAFIVGTDKVVTKELVQKVCSKQIPVMPWDISDAAGKKSKRKALTLAGLMFKYEGDNAAVPIVAALMRHVEKLIVARFLLDKGQTPKEIAGAINMAPFVYEKNFAAVVRKHSTDGLRLQMKKLCELETRVKSQAPSKRTLVDLAILSLAE